MSLSAKIRSVVVLGAVVGTGLLAGAFLSVSSAKERKAKDVPPVAKEPRDGGVADAQPDASKGKRKKAQDPADRVRRAQPIPRDYVE